MGLTVTIKALDPPVAHASLLEPGQSLGAVTLLASLDGTQLAPVLAVNRVRSADCWVLAKLDAACQGNEFEFMEDGSSTFVLHDHRAKLPAHIVAIVGRDVLNKVAVLTGRWVCAQPLVVAPDKVACAVLVEALQT